MSPDQDFAGHARMHRTAVRVVPGCGERALDDHVVDDVHVRRRSGGARREYDVVIVAEDVEPHDAADGQVGREGAEGVPRREYIYHVRLWLRRMIAAADDDRGKKKPKAPQLARRTLHAAYLVGRLATFASLGATLACQDNGPKTPIAPYALTALGTTRLPAVMFQEVGYKLEITAGTLELIEPDKYTLSLSSIETVDGNKSNYVDNESGTWVLGENGTITLTAVGGEIFTAVWNKRTLTAARFDTTLVFEMSR